MIQQMPEADDQPTGSLVDGGPVFLVVGKLRRPHGVQGELIMEVVTDFPERLRPGVTLFVGKDYQPVRIRRVRPNGDTLLIAFTGYDSSEAVEDYRNQLVYVRAADRPALPEGEYYHHQLLGLQVFSDEDQYLGILEQILETGANDVYVVVPDAGSDILLPAIDSVILKVNLEDKRMTVHLLPGLVSEI